MNYFSRIWKLAALFLLCASLKIEAQELTLLGGIIPKTNAQGSSYTWQVDYRQDFFRNFAGSIAYINEGHVPGHHRDGTAWEAWALFPGSILRLAWPWCLLFF